MEREREGETGETDRQTDREREGGEEAKGGGGGGGKGGGAGRKGVGERGGVEVGALAGVKVKGLTLQHSQGYGAVQTAWGALCGLTPIDSTILSNIHRVLRQYNCSKGLCLG